MFKFNGNQKVWLLGSNHPVTIFGRTEFFTGKAPRYYVQSETHIPGSNMAEAWVNEDALTDVEPVVEVEEKVEETTAPLSAKGKKGIRTTMKKG